MMIKSKGRRRDVGVGLCWRATAIENRRELAYGLMEHSGEHYGRLVVYYRANGMVPPGRGRKVRRKHVCTQLGRGRIISTILLGFSFRRHDDRQRMRKTANVISLILICVLLAWCEPRVSIVSTFSGLVGRGVLVRGPWAVRTFEPGRTQRFPIRRFKATFLAECIWKKTRCTSIS